jgi:hypothetical protein
MTQVSSPLSSVRRHGMPGRAGRRGSLVRRRQRAEIQPLNLAAADVAVHAEGGLPC